MKGLRLYKKEKLCSAIAIEQLFSRRPDTGVQRSLVWPLRALWRANPGRHADCPQFLIVIPKKRLRHAVDRVAMRRRVREAYRLNRDLLPAGLRVDVAFVWVADGRIDSAAIHRAVRRLLERVAAATE